MKEANCKSMYTRVFHQRHFAKSKIPNVTAGYLDPKGEPKNKSGGSLLTLKRIRWKTNVSGYHPPFLSVSFWVTIQALADTWNVFCMSACLPLRPPSTSINPQQKWPRLAAILKGQLNIWLSPVEYISFGQAHGVARPCSKWAQDPEHWWQPGQRTQLTQLYIFWTLILSVFSPIQVFRATFIFI